MHMPSDWVWPQSSVKCVYNGPIKQFNDLNITIQQLKPYETNEQLVRSLALLEHICNISLQNECTTD